VFGRKKPPQRSPEDLHRAFLGLAAAGASEGEFIASVRAEAARLVGAAVAAVFLYDPKYRDLYGRSLAGKEIRFGAGQGLAGTAAQDLSVVRSARPGREEAYIQAIDGLSDGKDPECVLAVPMATEDDHLFGVIEVAEAQEGRFSEEDAAYLEMFGEVAARLFESHRRTGNWRALVVSLAEAFGRAVDSKAAATVNHCVRVRDLAVVVGRSMGLTPGEVEALELAALLHDAGRLETASAEFSEAGHRIHIFFTEAFLRSVRFPPHLAAVPEIACAHHETFDGTGYPRGTRGADLSMAARILQVVNAYDALVFAPQAGTGRPLAEADALTRLRAGAGTLYDPAVVEAFISRKLYVQEKRLYARLERQTAVDVTPILPDGHEGRPLEAFALDLSSGGMLLDSPEELPVGTLLRAVIHLPSERLEAMAKVVRKLPAEGGRFRVGTHFLWQGTTQ
jgi:hypothetical protein